MTAGGAAETRAAPPLPEFSGPVYGGRALRELSVDGQNAILPWGVEFADSSAFYSLEDGVGYRYELLEEQATTRGDGRDLLQIVRLREGMVRLELAERLEGPRAFRRTCTLTCLEDTTLMDFVLRYRFLASWFPRGYIAGRALPYAESRVHYQYPVEEASVGNDRFSVRVVAVGATVPARMRAHVYLRDGDGAWTLHLRMLPGSWDREVIKLCSRWFGTRSLPRIVSAPLLAVPLFREALWYRGERRPWRGRLARVFSPSAYPMARLGKGETLRWDAVCRIEAPMAMNGACR